MPEQDVLMSSHARVNRSRTGSLPPLRYGIGIRNIRFAKGIFMNDKPNLVLLIPEWAGK